MGSRRLLEQNGYVQHADRVFREGAGFGAELVPLITEIHAEFMEVSWRKCFINFFDRESRFSEFLRAIASLESIEVFTYALCNLR